MRQGASLIELVVAIVVMGVVVASLPTLLLQTQNNLVFSLQQEVVFSGKAKVLYALAHPWDGASYDETQQRLRVLDTNNTAADSAFNHRSRFRSPTPPSHFLSTSALQYTDLDDFDGATETMASQAKHYDTVVDYALSTHVVYISDALHLGDYTAGDAIEFVFSPTPSSGTTNIKMLTVHAHNTDGLNLVLRAFASNIASRPIERKLW
jgi:hypothetical protein